ncbi:Serine--tRNA ligase [Apostasia shenzhenica]|uniref:Serine--tRNA ligase n=1 Tax=Apostasia shenzhenica TaxID=1088818 RepID=A0A2I0A8U9_9ASPA|nr:Serine--tRNA ligase [Apostasia shenzhenica]
MLDINLFREDKGNDPERVRESQRRRGAPVELVDEVIRLDKAWRQPDWLVLKAKQDASEKIKSTEDNKKLTVEKTEEVLQAKAELEARLMAIGNLVHDSVPISMDEHVVVFAHSVLGSVDYQPFTVGTSAAIKYKRKDN